MIPRAKPNYTFSDLLKAAFVRKSGTRYRVELVSQLGARLGAENLLLTASGRGALHLLFKSLPHPKVLLPAYTCKAVVEAALMADKTVLYVECGSRPFAWDQEMAENLMAPDVIVVATHQYGIPCDIERTVQVAHSKGAFVIEDAAAALGTRVNGVLTGCFGDAAVFSFDSTKLINVPLKSGFLVVQDPKIYRHCLQQHELLTKEMGVGKKWQTLFLAALFVSLGNHAIYRLFHNLKFKWRGRFTEDSSALDLNGGPFYRHRMSEWQALVALPQVRDLDSIVEKKQQLYAKYSNSLKDIAGISLPPEDDKQEWACTRFPILVSDNKMEFYKNACKKGLDFAFSFSFIAAPADFQQSHQVSRRILNPPYYLRLTDAEFDQSIRILHQVAKERT